MTQFLQDYLKKYIKLLIDKSLDNFQKGISGEIKRGISE